jgi:hypothetical protein
VANVVQGRLTNISCTTQHSACIMTLFGEVNVRYANSTGVLTVLAAGQSLLWSAPAVCNGLTGFTSAGTTVTTGALGSTGPPMGDLSFTVTTSPKPVIHHIP